MEYEIGSDESVSTAVVRAVSAVEGSNPLSMRPLSEVIDPDALDAVFAPRLDGTPRVGGRVSFVYSNCSITVDSDEYLTLELLDGAQVGSQERRPSHSHDP